MRAVEGDGRGNFWSLIQRAGPFWEHVLECPNAASADFLFRCESCVRLWVPTTLRQVPASTAQGTLTEEVVCTCGVLSVLVKEFLS